MNPQNPQDNQSGDDSQKHTIYSPAQPADVYGLPDAHAVNQNQPNGSDKQNDPKSKSKKGQIIAISAGVAVALLLIIGFVVLSNSGKSSNQTKNTANSNDKPQLLMPAQAIEIEQINNAISQDLSGLDDEKDYPAASLEDKTLGL